MKAIVVEDSRLAREGLVRMLVEFKELDVIGAAEDVSAALALIEQHQPDVIFLDIHMPEQNGFELLAQITYQAKIIFTTAYAEYAVQAFEHNSVDYLLKPISKTRLSDAVTKLTAEFNIGTEETLPDTAEPELKLTMTNKVFIKDGERCHLVPLADIDYFESCKNYTRVFFGKKNEFIRKF